MPSGSPHPAHPLTPYPPLIINAALTGMVPTRARVPHVPLTPQEIADDAQRCFAAGATVVHLHARDDNGLPDWRRSAYGELIGEIRDRCAGIVVCVTTSGRREPDLDKRADVLCLEGDARPDMASLTLGSLNFHTGPSVNSIETIEELAGRMARAGIRPELEIFDLGMAHLARRLLAHGLIHRPLYANLLLGFPNSAPADGRTLVALADALPEDTTWAAAGCGAFQLPANGLAVLMGGHVRTGLEDNPYLDHTTRAPATNEDLVRRAIDLAALVGRRPAKPEEARALLGLAAAPAPAGVGAAAAPAGVP
jgi:3-oxoadipate:acetyl-CoA acetyltransferase